MYSFIKHGHLVQWLMLARAKHRNDTKTPYCVLFSYPPVWTVHDNIVIFFAPRFISLESLQRCIEVPRIHVTVLVPYVHTYRCIRPWKSNTYQETKQRRCAHLNVHAWNAWGAYTDPSYIGSAFSCSAKGALVTSADIIFRLKDF